MSYILNPSMFQPSHQQQKQTTTKELTFSLKADVVVILFFGRHIYINEGTFRVSVYHTFPNVIVGLLVGRSVC